MNKTSIQWTDYTWNPLVGCRKASPGCGNCYAERLIATRLSKHPIYAGLAVMKTTGPQFTGEHRLIADRLDEPLRRRKGGKVFVNDLGDMFYEGHSFEEIAAVFGVMAAARQHTFQVLTKRVERMSEFMTWLAAKDGGPVSFALRAALLHLNHINSFHSDQWPLPNVWLGVSVEDVPRKTRIDVLRRIQARLRFLSVEPLLDDLGTLNLDGIGLVICGGESGPKARTFDLAWARNLRDQCKAAGVPFFLKQCGADPWDGSVETPPAAAARGERYQAPIVMRDSHGGDMAEWPEDLRIREMP